MPVIATNVTVKVKLHKGMEFRNENADNLSENNTLMTRPLGNVTEESEITFEYRMKDASVLAEMEDIDLLTLKEIPFQTQIQYTKLNGMKCVRTITAVQEISNDREEVEKEAKIDILAVNAAQQASRLASMGQF